MYNKLDLKFKTINRLNLKRLLQKSTIYKEKGELD
jgi:hypothetical protein